VRLTGGAVRELNSLPFDNEERREVGGWMFGMVDETEITVCAIRGAGWDTGVIGERDHMWMSGEFAADWEDNFRAAGWQAVGIIHSHPETRPEDELRLSGPDERAGIEAAERGGARSRRSLSVPAANPPAPPGMFRRG
jgi:Prokaryotic homologs of the JAB domain